MRPDRTRVKRVNVYRPTHASYYGPGLYGNSTACGQTLTPGIKGVAHKTLPCGTKITLHNKGRTLNVKVIDRGPYIEGRTWDLSGAACRAGVQEPFEARGADVVTTREPTSMSADAGWPIWALTHGRAKAFGGSANDELPRRHTETEQFLPVGHARLSISTAG